MSKLSLYPIPSFGRIKPCPSIISTRDLFVPQPCELNAGPAGSCYRRTIEAGLLATTSLPNNVFCPWLPPLQRRDAISSRIKETLQRLCSDKAKEEYDRQSWLSLAKTWYTAREATERVTPINFGVAQVVLALNNVFCNVEVEILLQFFVPASPIWCVTS